MHGLLSVDSSSSHRLSPGDTTGNGAPQIVRGEKMRNPLTADERERRFVEYIRTLNKGQLGEVRLRRMNKIANFRKTLIDLMEQMIEARAEDLAAAMLTADAPERPKRKSRVCEGRLVVVRKLPVWLAKSNAKPR